MQPLDNSALTTVISDPAQPSDGQWGKSQCLGSIDDPAQYLVVAGSTQLEVVADRPVFGAGIEPPRALEFKNRLFTICKHTERVKPPSREEWDLRADRAQELAGLLR